jgi:hypothetical protein
MRTTKHFIKHFVVTVLCALLSAPVTLAQNPQRNSQAGQAVSQDVLIIIQQQQVRFTAQRPVEQMQLQIFNQSGETVFDSGAVAEPELNWPLQDANGEAVKSGIYAYQLSIREAGAETSRVRRGHFIVDRARERDGQTDRLWITSQNDSSIGTELTVARNEDALVASASTTTNPTSGTNSEAQQNGKADDVRAEEKDSKAALGANITETANGNVGIGTTSPVTKLDVRGHLTLDAGSDPALFTAAAGGEQNRFLMLLNSPSYQSASGLKAGGILVSDSYYFANPGKNDLVVKGNVGIGIANPATKLHVVGDGILTGNVFFGNQTRQMLNLWGTGFGIGVQTHNLYYRSGGGFAWHLGGMHNDNTYNAGGGATLMTLDHLGLSFGARPGQHLRLWSDNATRYFGIGIQAETLYFRSGNGAGDGFAWYKGGFHNSSIGNGHRDPGGGQTLMTLDGESGLSVNGQASVKVLKITGGADFSENFDVNVTETTEEAATTKVEAGMVVSIDPENPGKLALSTQAYDYQVAGIISGAGGVRPGMILSQEGTLANGKHPVALSGRVYCWADASNGPIKPGDLLTTSDTPGHAMRVTDREKAHGAIIGKAMTGLKEGKGLVLVLVTLQ